MDDATVRTLHSAASNKRLAFYLMQDGAVLPIKSDAWNRSQLMIRDWLANAAINFEHPRQRFAPHFWFFCKRPDLINLSVTLPELSSEPMLEGTERTYFWGDREGPRWPSDGPDHVFFGTAVRRLGRAIFPETWRDDAPNYPVVKQDPVAIAPTGDMLSNFKQEREYRRNLAGWQTGQILDCLIDSVRKGAITLFMSEYLKREYEPCPASWWVAVDWSHILEMCSINRSRPQLPGYVRGENRILFVDKPGFQSLLKQGPKSEINETEILTLPTDRTGGPGAPSSMHLIEREMRARAKRGDLEASLEKEAAFLEGWFPKQAEHTGLRPAMSKAIKNRLRGVYRELRRGPE